MLVIREGTNLEELKTNYGFVDSFNNFGDLLEYRTTTPDCYHNLYSKTNEIIIYPYNRRVLINIEDTLDPQVENLLYKLIKDDIVINEKTLAIKIKPDITLASLIDCNFKDTELSDYRFIIRPDTDTGEILFVNTTTNEPLATIWTSTDPSDCINDRKINLWRDIKTYTDDELHIISELDVYLCNNGLAYTYYQ